MARKPALHAADDLLMPAVEATITAISPPDSDAALVGLARVLAHAVDRMGNAERAAMLGQTAPQLLRVLVELHKRAEVRAKAAGKPVPDNPIEKLRRAHAGRVGAVLGDVEDADPGAYPGGHLQRRGGRACPGVRRVDVLLVVAAAAAETPSRVAAGDLLGLEDVLCEDVVSGVDDPPGCDQVGEFLACAGCPGAVELDVGGAARQAAFDGPVLAPCRGA